MSIETTLYDLIEAVSAECNDDNQVTAIVQDLINSSETRNARTSGKIRIVSDRPSSQGQRGSLSMTSRELELDLIAGDLVEQALAGDAKPAGSFGAVALGAPQGFQDHSLLYSLGNFR